MLGADPGSAGLDWKARIGIVLQSSTEADDRDGPRAAQRTSPPSSPILAPSTRRWRRSASTDDARTRIRALSGGRRRRLDVALGIVGRPELLFLDEPTTGFDPEARRRFWQLIEQLKAEGTTILLTTHYLDEAAASPTGSRSSRPAGCSTSARSARSARRRRGCRWCAGATRTAPHEARTEQPATFVAGLVAAAGGEPQDVEIRRPSLEEIYLRLIGEEGAA